MQLLSESHPRRCCRRWPAYSYQVPHASSHSTQTARVADAVPSAASSQQHSQPQVPRTSSGTSAVPGSISVTNRPTVYTVEVMID